MKPDTTNAERQRRYRERARAQDCALHVKHISPEAGAALERLAQGRTKRAALEAAILETAAVADLIARNRASS